MLPADPSPSATLASAAWMVPPEVVEFFVSAYLGGGERRAARQRDDPRVSPLAARSLAGVAPLTLVLAEHDPVADDGRRYADALRRAGVP
eukprot:gene14982-21450_t